MATAAFDLLIQTFWRAGPFLILAGVAGMLLGGLLRWLEQSAPRTIQMPRKARGRPAGNVSAIHRQPDRIPDCPMCDVPMVQRIARHGPRAGTQFWGCSNFPMCRSTKEISRR